ncbi:uncharacterized protein LOC136767904 [Amia ocellicauda]|uniref:uncharacterized protein LOC136767904 n=1 Tax=Amia ocellicauda TaxID=2972642 RepID=UPI003463D391
MHIKAGAWEPSVCDPAPELDPLSDRGPLAPAATPHIRNRRLSPVGGGGGGGCAERGSSKQHGSPPTYPHRHPAGPHTSTRERRWVYRGRPADRGLERHQRRGPPQQPASPPPPGTPKREGEIAVGGTWTLLKPPPSFPVQDSPAKLQPTVSYASKVKGAGRGGQGEPASLGALLRNQWGLSFISDGPPAPQPPSSSSSPSPPSSSSSSFSSSPPSLRSSPAATLPQFGCVAVPDTPPAPRTPDSDRLAPAKPLLPVGRLPEEAGKGAESSGELLLSCRHLVEALRYHSYEWERACTAHRRDPARVLWYQEPLERPA